MEKQEMGTDIDAENIIENKTGNDRQLICNAYYDCACMHQCITCIVPDL